MLQLSKLSAGALMGASVLVLAACGEPAPSDPPPAPPGEPAGGASELAAQQDEAAMEGGMTEEFTEGSMEPDTMDDVVADDPAADPMADPLADAAETEVLMDGDLLDALRPYCGQSFAGEITSEPTEQDADFAGHDLVMHVRSCEEDEIQVPFHVGDNHSRTWVITRIGEGNLRLKHDHREEDGSEDVLTQYGGDTLSPPMGWRAEFPADDFSKELFEEQGIPVSIDNTWIMEVTPEETFVYTLTRPNRHFEVTFDLTEEVDTPPTPWGYEDD
ncbi:hypothetical protein FKB34_02785 [Glycocaulis profundi]|nr:hypothetical protein FKB34_02785 [Glycocaulis profundi]